MRGNLKTLHHTDSDWVRSTDFISMRMNSWNSYQTPIQPKN